MLGPRAVAFACELNKELGLSPRKTSRLLSRLGIDVTPGGVVGAVARQARRLEPTYRALIDTVASSPVVAPDETGWRVGGQKAWLWTFAGGDATVYLVASGRGFEHASSVLGERYGGVLERDGWAPYRKFTAAKQQSCYAHLLRRTGEMIADSIAGQARVPHAARRIFKDALRLRDQRQTLSTSEFEARLTGLNQRADKLVAMRPTHPPNRRLITHLRNEREHLFTFLTETGVQATNWRAEQALRPVIVNRKSWGGNQTRKGADTQQILSSVIRTARQQHKDPLEVMIAAQRNTAQASALLTPATRGSPAPAPA